MAIIKLKSHLDVYRHLAKEENLHQLTGRGTNVSWTQYINQVIRTHMAFRVQDEVLDIGCGDGSLIASIANQIKVGCGICPTGEEVTRLRHSYQFPNLQFRQGLSSQLPEADRSYSKVICNGVLLLLANRHELEKSLLEIARVAKPGARVYLGEILNEDEYVVQKKYGNSIIKWLWHEFRHNGWRSFLMGVRKVLRSIFTREDFIIKPKHLLVIGNAEFEQLCVKCGLGKIASFPYEIRDDAGNLVFKTARTNFIFERL